jgi:hypothetical protein
MTNLENVLRQRCSKVKVPEAAPVLPSDLIVRIITSTTNLAANDFLGNTGVTTKAILRMGSESPGRGAADKAANLAGCKSASSSKVLLPISWRVYESTNGGKNWSSAEPAKTIGDDWVNMSFDQNHDGDVTSDQGIYRVSLAEKKWTYCDGDLAVTQFYDITLDPENPDLVYGIGQDQRQVMKYTGSIRWDYMPVGSETGKVLVDPGNTKVLYVYSPQQPANWV